MAPSKIHARLLGVLVSFALFAPGCSATVRATLACEHCFCTTGFGGSGRDVRHPVSCDSIGYDIVCCMADSS